MYLRPCRTSMMKFVKKYFFLKASSLHHWEIFLKLSSEIGRSSRPEVFCEKGVLRDFAKFTGKHLWRLRPATLSKKRFWQRWFPMNFVKFLRTPFLQTTSGGCFWIGTLFRQDFKIIAWRFFKMNSYSFNNYHLQPAVFFFF